MKYQIILLLLLSIAVSGQTRDRRALIDVNSWDSELFVAPDEKMWILGEYGRMYVAKNIDASWRAWKSTPFVKDGRSGWPLGSPTIAFFDKQTAIIVDCGPIGGSPKPRCNYSTTTNGGRTWVQHENGVVSNNYPIQTVERGKAWALDDSLRLVYSKNYGNTWTTLRSPFSGSGRSSCISMSNSLCGVAGSDRNEIVTTNDNWMSSVSIPTPSDQGLCGAPANTSRPQRIDRVLRWNSYIIALQDDSVFYTDAANIAWRHFPIAGSFFEVDKNSKKLFVVSDSNMVYLFTSPTEYRRLTPRPLPKYRNVVAVVNGSLYVSGWHHDVYKINERETIRRYLTTSDRRIPEPEIVRRGERLWWGIEDNHLYLSTGRRDTWYREDLLDVDACNLRLLSDSVAIVCDEDSVDYLYSLHDHKLVLYRPKNPLSGFLAHPIASMALHIEGEDCFKSEPKDIYYDTDNKLNLLPRLAVEDGAVVEIPSAVGRKVSSETMRSLLRTVDEDPDATPSVQDFAVSKEDVLGYMNEVTLLIAQEEINESKRKPMTEQAQCLYSVPSMLDTLSRSTIKDMFDKAKVVTSTSIDSWLVRLVNTNNDTLTISHELTYQLTPFHIPWIVEYKGVHVKCYNIGLASYITKAIIVPIVLCEFWDEDTFLKFVANHLCPTKVMPWDRW